MDKTEREELRARVGHVAENDTSDGDWAKLLLNALDALLIERSEEEWEEECCPKRTRDECDPLVRSVWSLESEEE